MRRRPTWRDLPAAVAGAVETRLGAGVVGALSHEGGYSPGLAATLVLEDGSRVFVKAVDGATYPEAGRAHLREAAVSPLLPRPVPAPRLRWTLEESGWVVLALDALDGREPHQPWQAEELGLVLDAVAALARVTAPPTELLPPMPERLVLDHWAVLAREPHPGLAAYEPWVVPALGDLAALAAGWADAVAGDTLVHSDLRADNVVLTAAGARIVDWAHAVRGAPWVDLVGLLPSVAAAGGGDPEELLRGHPVGRAAPAGAVDAFLAALTGYFVGSSVRPAPSGIPHLREIQHAQGAAGLRWLRSRGALARPVRGRAARMSAPVRRLPG